MSMASPFELLRDLERQSASGVAALPTEEAQPDQWAGIVFSLGSLALTAPMSEVIEAMPVPTHVGIPGVKPWALGISNVRGSLLPIFDLHGFLYGRLAETNKQNRILVTQLGSIFAGLLVSSVTGLRYFDLANFTDQPPGLPDHVLSPYLTGAFRDQASYWHVFSPHALIGSPEFFDVAR